MKRLLYAIGVAAIASAAIVSCNGNNKATSVSHEDQSLPILGTWRYASMTYIVSGDKTDTVSTVYGPDTIQIYDVYRPDSILESYVITAGFVLMRHVCTISSAMNSILAENEKKKVQVHVANATDSTLNFDFTLADGDKTAFCETLSERCELPTWLKREIGK